MFSLRSGHPDNCAVYPTRASEAAPLISPKNSTQPSVDKTRTCEYKAHSGEEKAHGNENELPIREDKAHCCEDNAYRGDDKARISWDKTQWWRQETPRGGQYHIGEYKSHISEDKDALTNAQRSTYYFSA